MKQQNNLTIRNNKTINAFWNWISNNEEAIKIALELGINYEQVFHHFDRNFNYISSRIGYFILQPKTKNDKYTILFTADGYKKLFPKIIALQEMVPTLKHFKADAFIKPIKNIDKYKKKEDSIIEIANCKIKLSDFQMQLKEYNTETKQLKIKVFIPYYNQIKEMESLNIEFILKQILGEIDYRKHIKIIEVEQTTAKTSDLLSIFELPEYIEYLYKINSREITRKI